MWIDQPSSEPLSPRTAGNENTAFLKAIAIACMIVDHVGAIFFPRYLELRLIGRLAFPLFAWCLVVGCCYTRNIWRYALRIALLALISQPFYGLLWQRWNTCCTLLIGLLAIAGIRKKWHGSQFWDPFLEVAEDCVVSIDYNWRGVVFILMLYACRNDRRSLTVGMIAFCLFWSQDSLTLTYFLGMPTLLYIPSLPGANSLLAVITQVQFYAVLALPLILMRRPRSEVEIPKAIPYAMYPLHLLLIDLICFHGGIVEKLMALFR